MGWSQKSDTIAGTFELLLAVVLLLAAGALLLPAAGRGMLPSPVQPAAHSDQDQGCYSTSEQPLLLHCRKEWGFHGAPLPLNHLQQPSHLMMQIFLTLFYPFGCVCLGLVMVLQSGLDGQQSQEEHKCWSQGLVDGKGAHQVWVGGSRGLGTPRVSSKPLWAPATTESPKLPFFQPQAQFCALSCPEALVSLLVRNPLGIVPVLIQPSIPLHAHSPITRIQLWWGWGCLVMSLVTPPVVTHPP